MPIHNISYVFRVAKDINRTIADNSKRKRSAVLESSSDSPDLAEIVGAAAKPDGDGVLPRRGRARIRDMNSSAAWPWVGKRAAVGVAGDVSSSDVGEDVSHVLFAGGTLVFGTMTGAPENRWGGTSRILEAVPFDF